MPHPLPPFVVFVTFCENHRPYPELKGEIPSGYCLDFAGARQNILGVILIANPIYDSVFKYLIAALARERETLGKLARLKAELAKRPKP